MESRKTMNLGDLVAASMPGVSFSSLPLVLDAAARAPIAATAVPPARGAIAPLASARSLKPMATIQRSAPTPDAPTMTLPQRGREDQAPLPQMGTEDTPHRQPPVPRRAGLAFNRGAPA